MPSIQEAPTKKRKKSSRRKKATARKRSSTRTRAASKTKASAKAPAKRSGAASKAATTSKRTAKKRTSTTSRRKQSAKATTAKAPATRSKAATSPPRRTKAEATASTTALQGPPLVGIPTDTALILGASLRRAINSLWFAYQPIVDPSFQIVGYEALLRSQEPGLDTALPLLESARRQGLSDDLLLQMWKQAPAPFGPDGLADTWLFMNVEPAELVLFRDLARSGPLRHLAHRIVLEVTERATLRDRVGMAEAGRDLKNMGFRIAVDDFGGAFSGINTFAELEPDLIKLDGGLIRGLDRSAHRRIYIRKILEMCEELDVRVVAEQVETPAEFEALRDLGCHYLQGFFAGRPEPLGPSKG